MLRLLFEKDKSGICDDMYRILCGRLSFTRPEKREDERYIILFVEPDGTERRIRNTKRELLKIIRTVADAVAYYAVFSMSRRYIADIVAKNCEDSPLLDADTITARITEGIISELRVSLKKNRRHNWFTLLYRRVIENMLESGIFAVNSFFRFRISDFRSYVEEGTEKILERLNEEVRYMEFIAQLQYFVDKRRPKLYEMKVRVDDTGYTITDGNNEPVDFSIYEAARRENIDKEDLLIGVLLVAAPVRILVSADDAFFNTNLFSTMSNIFGDRIVVDYARSEN